MVGLVVIDVNSLVLVVLSSGFKLSWDGQRLRGLRVMYGCGFKVFGCFCSFLSF